MKTTIQSISSWAMALSLLTIGGAAHALEDRKSVV
jgi:hypothetical protein